MVRVLKQLYPGFDPKGPSADKQIEAQIRLYQGGGGDGRIDPGLATETSLNHALQARYNSAEQRALMDLPEPTLAGKQQLQFIVDNM